MFNLEEYKNRLVYKYSWKRDNTEEKRQKRREMLKGKDEYLLNIIKSTEEFVYFILTKMKEENHIFENNIYIILELESEENTPYNNWLSLNLSGGWPSDSFFYLDDPSKPISMILLQQFFKGFEIVCDCEDVERFDEREGIGWIDSYWQLKISGPIVKFNKLYNKVKERKNAELIKTLKRIKNK